MAAVGQGSLAPNTNTGGHTNTDLYAMCIHTIKTIHKYVVMNTDRHTKTDIHTYRNTARHTNTDIDYKTNDTVAGVS